MKGGGGIALPRLVTTVLFSTPVRHEGARGTDGEGGGGATIGGFLVEARCVHRSPVNPPVHFSGGGWRGCRVCVEGVLCNGRKRGGRVQLLTRDGQSSPSFRWCVARVGKGEEGREESFLRFIVREHDDSTPDGEKWRIYILHGSLLLSPCLSFYFEDGRTSSCFLRFLLLLFSFAPIPFAIFQVFGLEGKIRGLEESDFIICCATLSRGFHYFFFFLIYRKMKYSCTISFNKLYNNLAK